MTARPEQLAEQLARQELADDPSVDITTTGRRTGTARRIEIWMLVVDGRFFITGTPGPRAWLANLIAHPHLTVHLKHGGGARLGAPPTGVRDEPTRRHVLQHAVASWYRSQIPLDQLVAEA